MSEIDAYERWLYSLDFDEINEIANGDKEPDGPTNDKTS